MPDSSIFLLAALGALIARGHPLTILSAMIAAPLTSLNPAIAAGMDVDTFAPRLSHFFNSHTDFFEEIAKYRAARKLWYRLMEERYKPESPDAYRFRFHVQTWARRASMVWEVRPGGLDTDDCAGGGAPWVM